MEAGDLLVSLRDFHMLAIIDPDSNALKWYRSGPWVRQHDPDIAPDGTITLFNNRSGFRGQSQLLRYDPARDAVELLYPHDPDTPFFSDIMGTQQVLPNGNVLLTESTGGRIIEITPAGEVVWDYRAAFDEEDAALLTEAVRLAPDFFEPGALACAPSRRG
ncbi:arylsulfotransferase family protein [Sphingomicrobium astaxanthinifaciens]|uniref:arylsulfotransferase family protein n=1 Tax=Sphingomicrobium astaxanthinifaciens TaxID=1227949 RepID=UPI001FCB8006|nr:arylsulfotransferase family protein [Sphingomicrobium astaxanthinifaciens]MCJ7421780.1 arylsulfotransferase family protein [Sphingomicrobium astaxanthinifaciens]